MHYLNKISHIIRVHFFKALLGFLICIAIYQIQRKTSSHDLMIGDGELLGGKSNGKTEFGRNVGDRKVTLETLFEIGNKFVRNKQLKDEVISTRTVENDDSAVVSELQRDATTQKVQSTDQKYTIESQETQTKTKSRPAQNQNQNSNKTSSEISEHVAISRGNIIPVSMHNLPPRKTTEEPSLQDKQMMALLTKEYGVEFSTIGEYIEFMDEQIKKKPVFAYLNDKWNMGGGRKDYYERVITTPRPGGKFKCTEWTYDAANYVLRYGPRVWYQNEKCPLLQNETVKKVVLPDKKVIWKGCTRHTEKCPENPHYDNVHNLRRNVPPCCRDHLLEMLWNINAELDKRNISHIVTDGSVIGWYRNRKIVPYDNDMDMYIDGDIYRTEVWDEVFKVLSVKHGYVYKQAEDYKIKLYYSETNSRFIDIWPYFKIKLRTHYGDVLPGEWITWVFHKGITAIRLDRMFPAIRTTLNGVPCFIPKDPVNYLNRNYGPVPDKWMNEMTCKTVEDSNCSS